MPITDAEIVEQYEQRMKDAGLIRRRLLEVRDTYNSDIAIPLPEIDTEERNAVPNLIAVGVDGTAERIASVRPTIMFPGDADGDSQQSRKRARMRTDIVSEWWRQSNLDLKLYRRGRYYAAYGRSIAFIRPSARYEAPCFELRDPLTAYPSDEPNEDLTCADVIFCNSRSAGAIAAQFPDQLGVLMALGGKQWRSAKVDLLEYVSNDEWVTLARVASAAPQRGYQTPGGKSELVRLDRVPNRIGRNPIVLAGRYGLSRSQGQYDGMVGIYWTQAKLQALEVIAVTKDVFPNVWEVGENGQNPEVVQEADGIRGVRGQMRNGHIFVEQSHPGYMTPTTIDRLERNARVAGRIPPEYSGETGSNIRTGRRGDAVMSATVDFVVQEAQRIFARSIQTENELAIAIDKAYWGDTTKTIWIGRNNARRDEQYVPADLWKTDRHEVSYVHAGSDANSLTVGLLQLNGAGLLSKRSTRMQHPSIEDPEQEHDWVVAEALEQSLLTSIEAQSAQGALPVMDLARIIELVRDDKQDLAGAILEAQKEAQERQAQQAPPEAPAAQPGLSMPGMGAEAGGAPVPPPPQGLRNLQSLMGASRLINMRTPSEMAPVGNVSAGVA